MFGFMEQQPAPTSLRNRLRQAWESFQTVRMPTSLERRRSGLTSEVSTVNPYALFGDPMPYNPDALISRQGYSIIDEMRRDDQVKAALNFKKLSVLASGWDVKSPDDQAEDWEVTKFVKDALQKIDGTFESNMLEILSALDYGFSITEKVWYDRDDGKLGIKKLATRRPHNITFVTDIYGNLTTIRQEGREMPVPKFVLYSYDYEFSNHYGRTDLGAAYRPWVYKDNAYKWVGMLLERMGIPPVFAMYNSNKYQGNLLDSLRTVLSRMQAGTTATIPRPSKDDLELWSPELAGQVSTVFRPIIEMYNQDISRSLLMPELIGMTSDKNTGSLARAEVHFDVFMLVNDRTRKETQERVVQEQIVNELVDLNFTGVKNKPRFEWNPLTKDQIEQIATTWKTLLDGKAVVPQDDDEDHLRELLKFPPLDEKAQQDRAERKQEMMPPPLTPAPGQPVVKPPLTQKQFEQLVKEFAQ